MTPNTLLFDLDGTLTDPKEGITKSVDHALRTVCGIQTADLDTLTPYIGPPLLDGFMEHHGLDRDTALRCIAAYRERFQTVGLFENRLFPAIPAALDALHTAGYRLAVATSKPEPFSRRILDHFALTHWFSIISGATLDGTVSTKAEVVAQTLHRLGDPPPASVLMIGDRRHDVEGAAACGVRTVGVLFGFGSREELTAAGACALCERPEELPAVIRALTV